MVTVDGPPARREGQRQAAELAAVHAPHRLHPHHDQRRLGPALRERDPEGKLVPAAKITYDQDTRTIEIEDYGIEPVRLTQIEAISGKKATSR
jgi:hypothetical protein